MTHGKILSIYRHRNNCVGIVYRKIVDCPRKNICIVVVNGHATEKIGVGQVAVNGAGTFTAEDTERLVILKAARNNWEYMPH